MPEQLDDKDLRAAEYVLGTLEGAERLAFERELAAAPELQAQVVTWEQRLVGLTDGLPQLAPPAGVWDAIEQRLDTHTEPYPAPADSRWWDSLWLWRGLAGLATVALVAVLVLPRLPSEMPGGVQTATAPVYSVVMRDEQAQPQWLLVADWRRHEVAISRLSAPLLTEKDYELWLLPHDGAPVSMGVLRAEQGTAVIPASLSSDGTKAFAVSLEPRGGSPVGKPTGPVLYVAPTPESPV